MAFISIRIYIELRSQQGVPAILGCWSFGTAKVKLHWHLGIQYIATDVGWRALLDWILTLLMLEVKVLNHFCFHNFWTSLCTFWQIFFYFDAFVFCYLLSFCLDYSFLKPPCKPPCVSIWKLRFLFEILLWLSFLRRVEFNDVFKDQLKAFPFYIFILCYFFCFHFSVIRDSIFWFVFSCFCLSPLF